jgi:hypothetical protein
MSETTDGDPLDAELDFSKVKSAGRGVYLERYWRWKGLRLLDTKLAKQFPDDASVNAALSEYIKLKGESA